MQSLSLISNYIANLCGLVLILYKLVPDLRMMLGVQVQILYNLSDLLSENVYVSSLLPLSRAQHAFLIGISKKFDTMSSFKQKPLQYKKLTKGFAPLFFKSVPITETSA